MAVLQRGSIASILVLPTAEAGASGARDRPFGLLSTWRDLRVRVPPHDPHAARSVLGHVFESHSGQAERKRSARRFR